MPRDTRANDLWHWQTHLVVNNVDKVAQGLRENKVQFVSNQVRTLPDDRLGFRKGIMVLDPDGHAMLIVEK